MKTLNLNILVFLVISFLSFNFLTSCKSKENKDTAIKTDTLKPMRKVIETTKHSNIYEVNIRQYTKEGTFNAFATHIPRLKQMGVDILWLMPIFPIGEKNRKGSKGSYYSVQDYIKVNSEFGTEEDFKNLVKLAHDNGMIIILDWVANHTAWDNPWITQHPDWYTKDSVTGQIIAPVPDWTDVADLNYNNQAMRNEMIKSLQYWVINFDVDGFRCDVANMVPTDFWNQARPALDTIKPVFMLAEAEQADLHEVAFDMGYSWDLHHLMNDISKGTKKASDIKEYYKTKESVFAKDIYRMVFTSNHDENSWNGTEFERMPKSYKAFAVFTFVVPGMPLIYSGQEALLDRRLKFFDKDEIIWKETEMTQIYTKLIALKDNNEALWNGEFGGDFNILETSNPDQIFAFSRTKGNNKILVIFNLSDKPATFKLNDASLNGEATEYFTTKKTTISNANETKLNAWEYQVFVY